MLGQPAGAGAGPEPADGGAPDGLAPAPGAPDGAPDWQPQTIVIDDHTFLSDVWAPRRGRGHLRFIVTCKNAAHTTHSACRKRREVTENYTQRFGNLEPVAWLWAWLQKGDRAESQGAHNRVTVTAAELAAAYQHVRARAL